MRRNPNISTGRIVLYTLLSAAVLILLGYVGQNFLA